MSHIVVAAKIRAGRALLGLSQHEFARQCNLTRTTITVLEKDCSKARPKTLQIVFDFLENRGIKFCLLGGKLLVEANMLEII